MSADHLVAVSDSGIAAMSKAGVCATLLPGTSFSSERPTRRPENSWRRGARGALDGLQPGVLLYDQPPPISSPSGFPAWG